MREAVFIVSPKMLNLGSLVPMYEATKEIKEQRGEDAHKAVPREYHPATVYQCNGITPAHCLPLAADDE